MGIPGVKTDRDQILKAIVDADGIVYRAAKMLDVHRDVIYRLREKDEEVAKAIEDARARRSRDKEDWIDFIKQDMYPLLHAKMQEGDITAIIYSLKTFGGHSDGSGITINVIKKDPTVE